MTAVQITEAVHCQTVPMIGKDKDIESDDEARFESMARERSGRVELRDSPGWASDSTLHVREPAVQPGP